MGAGCPTYVGLILFILLMCWVGLLEGMQIAFFTVAKLPKSERGSGSLALKTCDVLFRNGGKNLPGFMCGRQMTVTLCFFIIARVTTINVKIGKRQHLRRLRRHPKILQLGFLGSYHHYHLGIHRVAAGCR